MNRCPATAKCPSWANRVVLTLEDPFWFTDAKPDAKSALA